MIDVWRSSHLAVLSPNQTPAYLPEDTNVDLNRNTCSSYSIFPPKWFLIMCDSHLDIIAPLFPVAAFNAVEVDLASDHPYRFFVL